ncbi:MAG TPA: zinc ribbon domain-containing protein [Pyrinomonadaceae bacterium]|nr:zinc ribbon domain-containing protein [Pyrinomonadaceae bacterium]
MYCPNCGTSNQAEQNYCRACGLKLDEISRNVAEQFPSAEYASIANRIRKFEVSGVFSLATAVIIAFAMLAAKAFQYKVILFGPDVLFYVAIGALLLFALFSVFCFNYKEFVNFDKLNPRLPSPDSSEVEKVTTNKFIEDRVFEPASVVEHTTELLRRK